MNPFISSLFIRGSHGRPAGLALIAMLALLAGCATLTRGTTEILVVETEPIAADVSITPGPIRCMTPCTLELKRKHSYKVAIAKPGYDPVEVWVLPEVKGAGAAGMAGNVLVGGLVGLGVDAASGATKTLTPNPVRVTLIRSGPEPPRPLAETPPPAPVAATSAEEAGQPVALPADTCIQPAIVDRETCRGRLRLGMSKDEVIVLLGPPEGTSRDGTTFRYGDRYLKFDSTGLLIRVSDKPI